jgi:hypothetical protein
MISANDRLEINEMLALYGHLIDQRRWSDLDQVFTPDVIFDGIEEITHGLASKIASWTSPETITRHPIAHHATNVIITEGEDGAIHVISKSIGIRASEHPSSVTYEDTVVNTPNGWRICHRKARRPKLGAS